MSKFLTTIVAKCIICKNSFVRKFLVQKTCLDAECIMAYSKEQREKEKSKEWKDRKAVLAKTSKSYPKLKHEAKAIFQAYCRFRDKDLPCISCGKNEANRWDGGHYRKAEVYTGVIFDERNVNKQCSRPCNKDLHGNEVEYRKGLIAKIGIDEVEKLEELANSTRYKKWSRDELHEIIDTYKLKKLP